MTEGEKKGIIIASVIAVAILILISRRGAAPASAASQAAPFALGPVTSPTFDLPPRNGFDIPTISINAGDGGLVVSSACCASCDSSGPTYYTPAPAVTPPAPPRQAIVSYVMPPAQRPAASFGSSAPTNSGLNWWDYVGVTGR